MLPSPQILNQVANFIQERGKSAYYCLFLLGKEAGLRISEAINFNLSLKKKSNLYLIQGKHHKKQAVFIDTQIISELKKNAWKPKQTNRFSFAHFLQRTKQELKISKNIELTPHTLRRCFATYQANSGMPLPILQKVLGHSSIRTTALYWKNSSEPKEKTISDKWLSGKLPKELPKIEPKEPLKIPAINNKWKIFFDGQRNFLETRKIFLNIQQEINIFISEPNKNLVLDKEKELLKVAFGEQREQNKLLQEKVKQLEWEKQEQEQIIINLKNAKERLEELNNSLNSSNKSLEKQLVQIQKEKDNLLKLLSTDLQIQQANLSNKEQNTPELHQQLIAQIQVLVKN